MSSSFLYFGKQIEPSCSYCRHGSRFEEDQILCKKRGVVDPGFHCKKFRYDPLKRIPHRIAILPKMDQSDFEL